MCLWRAGGTIYGMRRGEDLIQHIKSHIFLKRAFSCVVRTFHFYHQSLALSMEWSERMNGPGYEYGMMV